MSKAKLARGRNKKEQLVKHYRSSEPSEDLLGLGIYLDRGCGMWIWAGLCGTAYQMAHVPQRLIKATVHRLVHGFLN